MTLISSEGQGRLWQCNHSFRKLLNIENINVDYIHELMDPKDWLKTQETHNFCLTNELRYYNILQKFIKPSGEAVTLTCHYDLLYAEGQSVKNPLFCLGIMSIFDNLGKHQIG